MKYVYLNGQYVPKAQAAISVDDRGVVFGDALYESIAVSDGGLVDLKAHLDRLYQAMNDLGMVPFMRKESLILAIAELYRRERPREGLLYIQVSRGVYPRSHPIPAFKKKGGLFMYFKKAPTLIPDRTIKMCMRDDVRSDYCFYKSTALLPNILEKQQAIDQGYDEVLFKRKAELIEGASCNFFLVQAGKIYTCPDDGRIVAGVTRQHILDAAQDLGYEVVLQPPKEAQLADAEEAFVTHASNGLSHVSAIDERIFSAPGRVGQKLFEVYCETISRHSVAL